MNEASDRCPHCGCADNPLLHMSRRQAIDDDDCPTNWDESNLKESVTFTYLCSLCGATYWRKPLQAELL